MSDLRLQDMPDILSIQQLQDYLHIGKNNIYTLLKTGEIESIRVGKKYIIPKVCVSNFINRNITSQCNQN